MAENNGKAIVLVVDDTPENIDILSHVLKADYKVKAALDGEKAIRIANVSPRPNIILLDIMMPEVDGYEVCKRLKADPATAKIPIIFITAKNQDEDEQKGLSLGAVDYITKPINPAIVKARVATHIALHEQNLILENKVTLRTKELNDTRLKIIHRLGRAAEFKDNETGLHVIRMSHYAKLIASALKYDKQWSELIFNAAPMHDIGKIGIPDHILLKSGKLNDDEWELMRKHPQFGADIIGDHDSDILKMSKEIALTHHEKWDGSGYPKGLKGTDIPLSSRIIAIADVFDALTTKRPYKNAWSVEDAVEHINENAGTHFDPDLVLLFNQMLPDILLIKEQYSETEY